MHFHFDFSTAEVLWTLQFAALLVLLVVLLGRDRARRFPWFTTLMAVTALRMLAGRMLVRRLDLQLKEEIFLALADLSAIISLLVVVEVARRAFAGAGRRAWIAGALALLAVGGVVLALWGPWPSYKTLFAASTLSVLRFMDLFANKADLLSGVLIILLCLLVVVFGRHFKAGWHSHTQQLAIGLCMEAVGQLTIQGTLQHVGQHMTIHSQADFQRAMSLINTLNNANGIILIAVLVWWIICFWIDEPGTENRQQGSGIADRETGVSERSLQDTDDGPHSTACGQLPATYRTFARR